MLKRVILFSTVVALLAAPAMGQLNPKLYWTFLPEDQMALIVGEASGETAYNTIMETGGYNKNRQAEEYATTFYETQYIIDQLKLYGVPGAEVVRFPGRSAWDAIKGDLWEIEPGIKKIASYQDMSAMLASGSQSADVEAELVWVDSSMDLSEMDLEGKIVVSDSRLGRGGGLEGVLGSVTISTSRNYFDPLQIPASGSRVGTFGFMLPVREGQYLKQRLTRGEKIKVHAVVEATQQPYDLQDVIARIPGDDLDTNAVIFSAHLFEGITKQGANDNKSGSAGILEVARTLHGLIESGRLEKPKRSIRFLWGPEFSGTGPWVKENQAEMDNTFCNINMDMVGEWLSLNKAYMCMMRTTFGNAHYINDVMENYYRFVGEGNRERIQNRSGTYKVPHRIVAPTGADEPFYYAIETHYGASDHEVFNNWGVQVPGIMMIVWPDQWYHTSGDRIDKADPTQMKRISVIAAAAAYTIANADDDMAIKIAGEVASNGSRRLGHQFINGLEALNQADAAGLEDAYYLAQAYVQGSVLNERDTLNSVMELASDKAKVGSYVSDMQSSIELIGIAHLTALDSHMEAVAEKLGTRPVRVERTDLEDKAAGIVPRQTSKVTQNGYNGYSQFINQVPQEDRAKFPYDRRGAGDTSELGRLVNGKHSVLDIKTMLDAQSGNITDLQSVMNYLEVLKLAGLVDF
ncbi:MAG: M28 family peptidase [Planctomycetes bacterium]|nr:M28 family peptidase [Planctomycetota bacterium]